MVLKLQRNLTKDFCLLNRVQSDCTKSFNHSTVVCNPEHTSLVVGDEDGRIRVYKTSRTIPEKQEIRKQEIAEGSVQKIHKIH